MIKLNPIALTLIILCLLSCKANNDNKVEIVNNSPQAQFASAQIRIALQGLETTTAQVTLRIDSALKEQAYTIKKGNQKIVVSGGDETGLMYGGLELAEMIAFEDRIPELVETISGKPYIKNRGLKFNIPLDIRTPSYQDAGDAAQNNIAEMWNIDFWKAYLDMMAINRYNVLTLWNPHPFPSMIKMENYLDIALENVCGTSFPLDTDRTDEPDAKFIAGCGVSKEVLDNLLVLKEMTIEEKIEFWREVMKYAKGRGVEVYFITWNIWMNSIAPPGWYRRQENLKGDEGKYGINNDQNNPHTIAYLRKAVKEFILTYPDLSGIGVTAGENMEDRNDEYDREKWLWNSYGEGVLDAKKEQPEREIKFIHRYWQSGVDMMVDDFISKYPDEINLSFKYARARMYATPKPEWANEYINEYSEFGLKSWWNIRNDDIFHFRWGDPEYASEFIKNLPDESLTAGYFMGSDGYVWGREFISKHPKNPRELEIDKHWYNFMLWGRMGYNPELSINRLKGLLKFHYPDSNVDELYKVWATASRIPSLVTNFHWNDWDFQWAVEGCLDLRNGFHTVERFITNPTRPGSGILSIPDFSELQENQKTMTEITPLDVAGKLDSMANEVLRFIDIQSEFSDASFTELIYDLKAWAYMGKYYANKIRGAYHLHAYRGGLGKGNRKKAVESLESALLMWREYSTAASRNYNPQFLSKTRTIDWEALTINVENDIKIACEE
ncbi:hypothetical protein [Draconibacterium orientale]|uniref:hypothetical protein n=1 Tax=Draconibacterium orientale TaxID=1168034 RepID=UPI002ABD797E|nr:hypothetical protein [Draconibacterium orientale]